MGITDQLTDLLVDNVDKTSEELKADFAANPTGSILLQKIRRRAVAAKLQTEQQTIVDSVVNAKLFPKAVCEYGKDGHGRFAKVYLDGKAEIIEDD